MRIWRLLPLRSSPPAENVALDEALLRLHAQGRFPPTLRFYTWSRPAVTLGYCQHTSPLDPRACRDLGIEVLRRLSGGRAVLHGGDLCFSLVGGPGDGLAGGTLEAYRRVGAGLLEGLRLVGIKATLGGEVGRRPAPDLCFLRQDAGDVIHAGRKLGGCSQAWYRSSLLLHGSILLEPQADRLARLWAAPGELEERRQVLAARLGSVRESAGRTITPADLAWAITRGLQEALRIRLECRALSAEEQPAARRPPNISPLDSMAFLPYGDVS